MLHTIQLCDRYHWKQSVATIGYWPTAKTMAAQGYTMQETRRMIGQPPVRIKYATMLMYTKDISLQWLFRLEIISLMEEK